MVSGDFCNVFKIDNDNIGFYIGDVSGTVVPAAMLTIFLNQTVKTLLEMETNELNKSVRQWFWKTYTVLSTQQTSTKMYILS